MAHKLTPDAAREIVTARKTFRGGRPCKPQACPRCGAPCDSATQAAAHCMAPAVRDREAAARRAAIRKYTPEMLRKKFPGWRYHRTAPAIIVNSPEEEAALGEGWAETPAAFQEPGKVE